MKRKSVIFIISLFLISAVYAQDSKDYFELNKIEKVNSIIIVNQQRGITLRLNEEQAESLIKKLKVSKKLQPTKIFYPYTVEIYYEDQYISFMTNGKTLGASGTSEKYELVSDCSDIIKSVFDIYDAFLNPEFDIIAFVFPVGAGSYYLLQNKDNNKYYIVEVVWGSGLPVISITAYEAVLKNDLIVLDNVKISVKDMQYEIYVDGKKTDIKGYNSSAENLQKDMHAYFLYHH